MFSSCLVVFFKYFSDCDYSSHQNQPHVNVAFVHNNSSIPLHNSNTFQPQWILDTRATDHISNSLFTSYRLSSLIIVDLPNDHKAILHFKGTVHLLDDLVLTDVIYLSKFHYNGSPLQNILLTLIVNAFSHLISVLFRQGSPNLKLNTQTYMTPHTIYVIAQLQIPYQVGPLVS